MTNSIVDKLDDGFRDINLTLVGVVKDINKAQKLRMGVTSFISSVILILVGMFVEKFIF